MGRSGTDVCERPTTAENFELAALTAALPAECYVTDTAQYNTMSYVHLSGILFSFT